MIARRALAVIVVFAVGCITQPSVPRPASGPILTPLPTPAQPDTGTRSGAAQAERGSADRKDTVAATAPDVTAEAQKIFGDTVAKSVAESTSVAAGPTWDMDVRSYETRDRVQYWINRFSHEARSIFTLWLNRSHRYDPIIRPKLKAAGLPEDLSYLALIESGYDPHAYSRAAAVGMWQLMTSTAKDAGLRVDWWVDERRDPVRSTDAAVRFLHWLNGEFGSLYLAAAAYDGGPGRIARGLTRYADDLVGAPREDAFFVLAEKDYLRAETKEYVPQLIAAALVAKEPERYGIQPNYLPPLEFDTVRVGPATPLATIAKAVGISLADVRDLNPFILRGLTPPKDSSVVRVPVGQGAGLLDAIAALPSDARRGLTRSAAKKGETIESIARHNGLTVKQLMWYNRSVKSGKRGRLATGQEIFVPSAAVVSAALDVPDPAIEKYGSSSRTRTVTHVVKHGETLSSIAKRFSTTTATLKKLNGFKGTKLVPGQVIIVKRSTIRAKKSSGKSRKKSRASPKKKAASSSKSKR